MSLINCPECGKEISDISNKCVHCGYPIKEEGVQLSSSSKIKRIKKSIIIISSLFAIFIIIILSIFLINANRVPKGFTKEVYNNAKEYIRHTREYIKTGNDNTPKELDDFFETVQDNWSIDIYKEKDNRTYTNYDYELTLLYYTIDFNKLAYEIGTVELADLNNCLEKMESYLENPEKNSEVLEDLTN